MNTDKQRWEHGIDPLFARVVLLICLMPFGCAAGPRQRRAAPATAAAATSAPATQPARLLKIADGASVDHFRNGDADVDLRQIIKFANHNDVYFGSSDVRDADDEVTATTPLVVARVKGGWKALSVADDRLPDAEWMFVASGPARQEIWGVLDSQINDTGKILLLVHSTDAGQTWSLVAIDKPFQTGDYDSFCMDRTGHGRLTIYLDRKSAHGRGGFYNLRTADGGKTWSGPDYEPDAMHPADDVNEDEPEPLQTAPTQNASSPTIPRASSAIARAR